jgi:hypothetical protein
MGVCMKGRINAKHLLAFTGIGSFWDKGSSLSPVGSMSSYWGCCFFLVSWGGVRLSPFCMSATIRLLYQPRMKSEDECGAIGGMIGRWNRNTKPTLVPIYSPQIPHDLTGARTRATEVGSRRLGNGTATSIEMIGAVANPCSKVLPD